MSTGPNATDGIASPGPIRTGADQLPPRTEDPHDVSPVSAVRETEDTTGEHSAASSAGDSYPEKNNGNGAAARMPPRAASTVTLNLVQKSYRNRLGDAQPPPGRPTSPNPQTDYASVNEQCQSYLARKHVPYEQMMRAFGVGLFRWLITAILVGAAIGTLKGFGNLVVMSESKKHVFNAIITGLSLALGLNVETSLRAMASNMRWKILSLRPHTLHEVDLILGSGSLSNIGRLLFFNIELCWHSLSRRWSRHQRLPLDEKPPFHPAAYPWAVLAYGAWLLVIVGLQLVVAILGLTYSVDSAAATVLKPGQVSIPLMDHFYSAANSTFPLPDPGTEQATAHSYGYVSAAYPVGYPDTFNPEPDSSYLSTGAILTFELDNLWLYQFRESDWSQSFFTYTNRTVNVTWACGSFDVLSGADGNSPNITFNPGSANRTLQIGLNGPGATTYVTETEAFCGPRCSIVWAFQAIVPESDLRTASLTQCNITVSGVTNAYLPQHAVSDGLAQIAAGAIGLDGFDQDLQPRTQATRFHDGSTWAGANQTVQATTDDIGSLIAQYAAGALALAAYNNPVVGVAGQQPHAGVVLDVQWNYAIAVLAGLAGGQALLCILSTLWSNNVVIKDDSYLAISRLLRPLISRLGHSGCLLTGKEISETLSQDRGLVYGVKTQGEWNHLDVSEDFNPTKIRDAFPSGWYDGYGPNPDPNDVDEYIVDGVEPLKDRPGFVELKMRLQRSVATQPKAKAE